MTHDVFISYSSKDKTIADAVCAKLEERDVRCWIAPRDVVPGAHYAQSIIDAIDASRAMVLIFSSDSNESKHVMREAEQAVHNGIPIVSFRIENIEPSGDLRYSLAGLHWLDAITPPLENHIYKLADAINVLTAVSMPEPEPQPEPQPEPDKCKQCGTLASPGTQYCRSCGALLLGAAPPAPSPPMRPEGTSPTQIVDRLLNNRKMMLAVAAIILAAVVLGGTYASGMFTPASSPTPAPIKLVNGTTLVGDRVVFQNATVGVKFSYPNTWLVSKDPTSNGNNSDRYYYTWPPSSNYTRDLRSFGFYKQPKESYAGDTDAARAYNKTNGNIAFTRENYNNVTVLEPVTATTLGGMPAYKATWSYVSNNSLFYSNQIWAVKGDYIYGIIYTSNAEYHSASLDQLGQIIQSFGFI